MNMTTVITVNGTKKSERGLGLDDGEVSQFTIKPGEYDRMLSGVDDLVAQIEHSAYMRGEWISSLCVDGIDLVERFFSSALRENDGNIEAALQDLSEMAIFCNADATDLLPLLIRASEAEDAG
jgi:hypothetical protein